MLFTVVNSVFERISATNGSVSANIVSAVYARYGYGAAQKCRQGVFVSHTYGPTMVHQMLSVHHNVWKLN